MVLIDNSRVLGILTLFSYFQFVLYYLSGIQMFGRLRQVKEAGFIELTADLDCLLHDVLVLFEAGIPRIFNTVYTVMLNP